MATNVFKHAKTVQRKHPNMSWKACVKKAAVELRKKNKVSGVKKKKSKPKRKPARRRMHGTANSPDRNDRKKVDITIAGITGRRCFTCKK